MGFMWFGTKKLGSTMMELLFSNSIAMIWRRVQVIIILVLFFEMKGRLETDRVCNPAVDDVTKRSKISFIRRIILITWHSTRYAPGVDSDRDFRYKDGERYIIIH